MNRRELLRRGFELGAAGLILPMVEPIRRYWSLDRTMIPATPAPYDRVRIGDYTDTTIYSEWVAVDYTPVVTDVELVVLLNGQEVAYPLRRSSPSTWETGPLPHGGVVTGYRYIYNSAAITRPPFVLTVVDN